LEISTDCSFFSEEEKPSTPSLGGAIDSCTPQTVNKPELTCRYLFPCYSSPPDVEKDSHVLSVCFEKKGAPVPGHVNPAEFMLEAIGADSAQRMGGGDWAVKWWNSEELLPSRFMLIQLYPAREERAATDLLSPLFLQREIKQLNEAVLAKPDDINVEPVKEYAMSFQF
jgi:hypothetical protein